MKVKSEYVLRQVADVWVVMPIGEEVLNFDGMLTLNESGALLWRKLEEGADREALVAALISEYDVAADRAGIDVEAFCHKLLSAGCVDLSFEF